MLNHDKSWQLDIDSSGERFTIQVMGYALLVILGLYGMSQPTGAACVDITMNHGSVSVLAIRSMSDPAVLILLTEMPISEASNSDPRTFGSEVAGIESSQNATNNLLHVQTDYSYPTGLVSTLSGNVSRSLMVESSRTDLIRAISWMESLSNDPERVRTLPAHFENTLHEEARGEVLLRTMEDRIFLVGSKGGDSRRELLLRESNLGGAHDWIARNGLAISGSGLGSTAVPEPSVAILVGIGVLGFLSRRR